MTSRWIALMLLLPVLACADCVYCTTDAYVDIPHTASMAGTNTWTVSLWVKDPTEIAPLSYSRCILDKHDRDNNEGWSLQVSNDSKINVAIGSSIYTSTVTRAYNTWRHYAVVRDGTTMYLYSNGALGTTWSSVQTAAHGSEDIRYCDTDNTTTADDDDMIDGTFYLDDVRLYTNVLSAAKVAGIYAAQGSDFPTPQQGCIGRWYPVAQTRSTGETTVEVIDYSGAGNHGTLEPSPSTGPTWVERDHSGHLGGALEMDSSVSVQFADTDTLSVDDSVFTIAGWIRCDNFDDYYYLWANKGTSAGGTKLTFFTLYILQTTGKPSFFCRDNDNDVANSTNSAALAVGTWTCLVGTYSNKTSTLYVNGAWVDSDANASMDATIDLNGDKAPYVQATVGEVLVYKGLAWDSEQVAAYYNTGTIPLNSLVQRMGFRTPAHRMTDISGSGNHGYFVGAITISSGVTHH